MLTRIKSHVGSFNKTIERKYLMEKCRICLDDGEILIFGANDISDDVAEFGNIKVYKDDNLPQYLCEACAALLESAILFRKTAKQSDEVLRQCFDTEESDCKQEDETYIKREYLELKCTSDSESDLDEDDFDKLKRNIKSEDETTDYNLTLPEVGTQDSNDNKDFQSDLPMLKRNIKSEDETTNYNLTFSEVDTQESNDNKDFQSDLFHIKREENGSINEADSETIMIIVSDKDKQKLEHDEGASSYIYSDNDDETTKHNLEHDEDASSYIDSDNDDEKTKHSEKSLMKILPYQRECEVCHSIILKSAYKVHLKEHRKKYKDKYNKKYAKIECEFCGKHISKSYLKIHMKSRHGTPEEQAESLVKCTICSKMFKMRYYNDHVRRMHPTKSEKNQTIKNVMGKEAPLPTPNYYKCPVCDRKIRDIDYKLHLEKHNGPLPRYVCEKCGKVFKHPSAFKTHCLTHGSELKYKCQFCPYRGLHQGLLKIHVRTHTGDYNYKCTECPAKFITKSNLTKHLNRHKGLYSFKCEQCNKGFYFKRDLEKHIRNVHMSVKHHICEYCGKAFGHRDNIMSHQLKVHKREKIMPMGRMPSYLKAELMQFD